MDEEGRAREWWSPASAAEFAKRSQCVARVFGADTQQPPEGGAPAPSAQPQTLSEDLADVGGLQVALEAYLAVTTGATSEDLRSFFLAFAQNWCYKARARESAVLVHDVHAPGELRANAPLSFTDAFSTTYRCASGSRMNPERKCGLWSPAGGT